MIREVSEACSDNKQDDSTIETTWRLVLLLPEQVSEYWELFGAGILRAIPSTIFPPDVILGNVLEGVLDESIQCWAACRCRGSEVVVYGVIATMLQTEGITGEKFLLVYAIASLDDEPSIELFRGFKDALHTLHGYAMKNDCTKVIGFAPPALASYYVKKLGGKRAYECIEWEVDNGR